MEFSTEGSTQIPNVTIKFLSAPTPPDGMFEMPTMGIAKKADPFVYTPMGRLNLEIGEKIYIRNMDMSGEWCFAYVIKKLSPRHGNDHPSYLIGTQHQMRLDI